MADVTDPSSKIFGQTWAVRLGAAFLLGYAVVTGFAMYENSHRATIERTDEPTAIGDKTFFPAQEPVDKSLPLAHFDGHALYFAGWQEAGDAFMLKAGMDDTRTYSVYKMEGAKGEEADYLYLRTKPGYYARTKAGKN